MLDNTRRAQPLNIWWPLPGSQQHVSKRERGHDDAPMRGSAALTACTATVTTTVAALPTYFAVQIILISLAHNLAQLLEIQPTHARIRLVQ